MIGIVPDTAIMPQDRDGPAAKIRILSYALLAWPLTIAQLSLVLVAPFYAAAFGLPLTFVGFVLTMGRILDVFADVAVAWGSDQTRTRWGRRKPWVIGGVLLYIPATIFLFIPPASMTTTRFVATVMLFFMSWTASFVPYLTQGTELTHDYNTKNRINVVQSAIMLTGLLLAFITPFALFDPRGAFVRRILANACSTILPAVADYLRGPSPTGAAYYGHSMLVITVLALTPLVVALPIYIWSVHEPKLGRGVGKGSITSAFRNRLFMRFSFGYVFMMISHLGRGGLLPFILAFALRLPNSYLFFMMLFCLSSLVVTPFWGWVMRNTERSTCIILAATTECAGLIMLILIPPESPLLTAMGFITLGLSGQTILMLPYLIAADCADYSQWKTGADSRAIHLSMCSLIAKLGTTFAGISVWIAGLVGFNPTHLTQPAHMVAILKVIGLGIPIVCLFIGSAIILGFPLNRRRHSAVRNRIERRAALRAAITLQA